MYVLCVCIPVKIFNCHLWSFFNKCLHVQLGIAVANYSRVGDCMSCEFMHIVVSLCHPYLDSSSCNFIINLADDGRY